MIEELLKKSEGKTLEFKENADALKSIVKSVVAFANTAGGMIVVGVKDGSHDIVGVEDALKDESRIGSSIADQVAPLILPEIEVHAVRGKQLLLIRVAHSVERGPFHLKAAGEDAGTYVRLGSSNRRADEDIRYSMQLMRGRISFDELPCIQADMSELDLEKAGRLLKTDGTPLTVNEAKNLSLIVTFAGDDYPSRGGILLFGKDRYKYFSDARVRCGRFLGSTKTHIMDDLEIEECLPLAIDHVINFVRRSISTRIERNQVVHKKTPQYPLTVLREAITNAILHADYSISGMNITIAVFDDRIEIRNPGGLLPGLTMDRVLEGCSRPRNKVIARIFKELGISEQWGSGVKGIIDHCREAGLPAPEFDEIYCEFKLTLFGIQEDRPDLLEWQHSLVKHLKKRGRVTTIHAAKLWRISSRSARDRMRQLTSMGLIMRIATSDKDPGAYFVLRYDPNTIPRKPHKKVHIN